MVIHRNNNHGHLAELRFILEATKMGFVVSEPMGDYHKYDYILEYKGKLLRVQVKSTVREPGKYGSYQITTATGHGKAYTNSEVDFFVIYIRHERAFFILPSKLVASKLTISISPKNKLWGYKNQWDLMK